jgi:hypothetical protein
MKDGPLAGTGRRAVDESSEKGAGMKHDSHPSLFVKTSIILLVFAALHYRVSYTPADADLWGHVKFGQDIRKTGRIVESHDPYSYLTAGQPWINHEWLAEYAFAVAYDRLGATGLVLLKTTIDMIILVTLDVILLRHRLDPLRAAIVIVPVAFLLFYHVLTVRPHIFTYILFLATLIILEKAETGRDRWLLLLPPIFVIWVNLHGGFLVGMGVLIAWSLTHLFLAHRHQSQPFAPSPARVLCVLVGCSLALLVNPYGYKLLELLLRTATVPRPEIEEWKSVTEVKYHFFVYLLLALTSFFSLSLTGRARRPALLIIYLMTAVLPLLAIRHLPLFAIALVVINGEFLGELSDRLPGSRAGGKRSIDRAIALISVVAGALLLAGSLANYRCILLVTRLVGPYPARAAAVLQQTSPAGNLACHFNWGEYLIWHVGPRLKVSIDGRRETIYSDAVYEENGRFARGEGDWNALIRRPETDLVIVPKGTPPFNLLVLTQDWTAAYEDAVCVIFARKGSTWQREISRIAPAELPCDGDGLCFP